MDIIPGPSWSPSYYQSAILDFCNECKRNALLMKDIQRLVEDYPIIGNGAHYWRQVSENGTSFGPGHTGISRFNYVLAWSRILNDQELICGINLHHQNEAVVYTTFDNDLHALAQK